MFGFANALLLALFAAAGVDLVLALRRKAVGQLFTVPHYLFGDWGGEARARWGQRAFLLALMLYEFTVVFCNSMARENWPFLQGQLAPVLDMIMYTLLCGKTKLDFALGFNYTPDMPYFEEEIWPNIADRMPALDNLKLLRAWRGCYEYNNIDFNAIIGQHPDVPNFYLINGFSGHGMMQSPAAGRGLAEYILYNEYRTIDLSAMNIKRFRDNKLIVEKAII